MPTFHWRTQLQPLLPVGKMLDFDRLKRPRPLVEIVRPKHCHLEHCDVDECWPVKNVRPEAEYFFGRHLSTPRPKFAASSAAPRRRFSVGWR